MQEQKEQPPTESYLGIDVGKDGLDIFIHPSGQRLRVSNDAAGLRRLIRECGRLQVRLVALEATGKYHCRAHQALHEAGLAVAVVNPYRSRKFADALGQLAKTDTIDAEVLARYAALVQPQATPPPSAQQKALRELNVARRQVIDELGDLKRQLQATDNLLARRQLKARMALCERHRGALEKEIAQLVALHDDLRHRFDILTSIPGLGVVTAATLLTDLEELGRLNSKEIAALAGLAPMNRDSGNMRGVRTIRGGRLPVRNMLYMCAVGLSRRDGSLGCFYRRLVREGKNPKVALTAVARKLVILANTLVAENRHWVPALPAT
jgi:transposase